MKKTYLFLPLLALVLAACGTPQPVAEQPPALTPTVTFSPTTVPSHTPTRTPTPPTLTATPMLIEGTLTIKVNVRSGPGTTYNSLGLLDAEEKVQILFSDPSGKWYRILYPAASEGYGWVVAQFVRIPVWTQVPLLASPTPAGPSGRVLQRLNVRSGPGTMFDSLGLLEPDAVVSLTGKNSTASWFQIAYPSGPGGHGWVTAQFIQADSTALPVLDDYGTPVLSGTSGPTSIPVTPTPTIGPAFDDKDSPASPAVRVILSASGTRQFTYSSQLSSPKGDPADWVEFTPHAVNAGDARLVFSLVCSGNGTLSVAFLQDGTLLPNWGTLACGDLNKVIPLPTGHVYQMHLVPIPGDGLTLVNYVLTVQNNP